MYAFRNPQAVNEALGKTGSQYRVDENGMQPTYAPQPVAQPATQPAVQIQQTPPPEPPPQATDVAPPPAAQPAKQGGFDAQSTWNTVSNGIAGAAQDDKQAKAMQRVGALVGTVLSLYTGNYGGAASGMKAMGDQAKAK